MLQPRDGSRRGTKGRGGMRNLTHVTKLTRCLSSATEKTSEGVNETAISTSIDIPSNPSIAATIVQAVLQSSPLPACVAASNPDTVETITSPTRVDPTSNSNSEPAPSDISKGVLSAPAAPLSTETNSAISPSDVLPGSSGDLSTGANASRETEHIEVRSNDVTMEDSSPPPKPHNDEDLPPWLAQMISYLRDVAEDTPWQDLVTGFVEFEKGRPPIGVSLLPVLFWRS